METKNKKKVSRKVAEMLPFLDMKNDMTLLKDELMDILEIEGKDIFSLTEDELMRDISILHSFLKVMNSDIKLVSMNFPVDASEQLRYINYKINKTDNKVYKDFLNDKKKELEYLEKNRTDKEYYIFLFAKNPDNLNSIRNSAYRIIKNVLPIKKISKEKKEMILFKLNNMNSKITSIEGDER